MGTENFNRQFILLDFADLDNPDFLSFTRSPEFSTYLLMRRYVWRSHEPHYMGLHEYFAKGHLACSLDREKIAEQLRLSLVSVSTDIAALAKRGVIRSLRTGRQNIFVLGRWVEDEGARFEHFYLDRLYVRSKENFISAIGEGRYKENFTSDVGVFFTSDVKKTLHNNREENREENREHLFENSNIRRRTYRTAFVDNLGDNTGGAAEENTDAIPSATVVVPGDNGTNSSLDPGLTAAATARRAARPAAPAAPAGRTTSVITDYIGDVAREFNDEASLKSSVTRARNLYKRAGIGLDAFTDALLQARAETKQHSAGIRKETGSASPWGPTKNRMAYFFALFEDKLGLAKEEAEA